jgi:glutathione reductase (NADPH)
MSEALRHSKQYGFKTPDNIPYDFAEFKKKRDSTIEQLNRGYENNWDQEGIELVHGTARFTGRKELEIELEDGSGKVKVAAPRICIATGGYPVVPKDIPGAEFGITSEGFFDIEQLPSKIAVVGAGYIAVEIAGMLNAIGIEVHMFIRGQTFLRNFDPMIQETMTRHYEEVGITVHKGYTSFDKIERLGDGIGDKKILKITAGEENFIFNELLWAIGRSPETQSLALNIAGIETGKEGHIITDKFQNTNAEGIYALGDVTGHMELTPGMYLGSIFPACKSLIPQQWQLLQVASFQIAYSDLLVSPSHSSLTQIFPLWFLPIQKLAQLGLQNLKQLLDTAV